MGQVNVLSNWRAIASFLPPEYEALAIEHQQVETKFGNAKIRDAADCAPKFGDRAGYQMDPGNAREALREAALDEAEGADMLMVKPALPYLDILRAVRERTNLPLAAYNVSGEYAMLHAAAAAGMLDLDRAIMEVLTSIRRAGADLILTYHALRAAEILGG